MDVWSEKGKRMRGMNRERTDRANLKNKYRPIGRDSLLTPGMIHQILPIIYCLYYFL